MMNKIRLFDVDGTIRTTSSGKGFINEPHDQELLPRVGKRIQLLAYEGFECIGVTNQGGVKAGYKTLRSCILEQRRTLEICPGLEKIYFSVDDETCWVISRAPLWAFKAPLWLNLPWRWEVDSDHPRYYLGGFRKPNPGMLRLAIAESHRRYCDGLISPWDLAAQFGPDALSPSDYKIDVQMIGDREEDQIAAARANIEFCWSHDFFAQKPVLRNL